MEKPDPCPCGSNSSYKDCCNRYIDGRAQAPTAEALMRSRYTAYTLSDVSYLSATWESNHCPKPLTPDDSQRWIGLKILNVKSGKETDSTGSVEFVAKYKIASRAFRLHEISLFTKQDGHWLYLTGKQLSPL